MKGLICVLIGWLGLACQTETRQQPPQAPVPSAPAFYHWKSTFAPTPAEQELLQQAGVQTLYVRFFDVVWDAVSHQPVPAGVLTFRARPTAMRIIPVVFITNQTLLNLSPGGVPDLARRIALKVGQLAATQTIRYPELQLDCDWTRRTRTRYFALLKALAAEARVPLSATIRLHQVKYVAQTGVPPVSRGMLMAYNIGDWKRPETRNSILDLADLRRYIDYLPGYPLPLDLALPLFRWTVIFRNDKVLTLRTNLAVAQVRSQPFVTPFPADSARFLVTRDTTVWGISLRRGDWLRTEACPVEPLLTARAMLLSRLPPQTRTFTLYHLDSTVLRPYSHAALTAIFHSSR